MESRRIRRKFRLRTVAIGSIAVVLAVISVFLIVINSSTEPVVEGRRISAWLLDLQLESGEKRERAVRALSLSGTNALPYLVGELTTIHSSRKKTFLNWVIRQDWLISLRQTLNLWRDPSEEAHRSRAKAGFRELGFTARPAFPLLTNALTNSAVSADVAEVLVGSDDQGKLFFGPAIGSAFLAVIHHENSDVRRFAVYGIGRSQTKAETFVPHLLAAFKDDAPAVREAAVMGVGGVYKKNYAEFVPALIRALDDPSTSVRRRAITMLGFYGSLAQDAVPVLERLAGDPNDELNDAARIALSRIREE